MEKVEIFLNSKQYTQLERLLRCNCDLSAKLASNSFMNGKQLLETIICEITDLEYDEDGETPLKYRIYEPGRELLQMVSQQLYPKEPSKLVAFIGNKSISIDEKRFFIIVIIK